MLTALRFNAKKPTRLLRAHEVSWGAPRRGHSGEVLRIAGELKAEREAAQEAAKAALSRMGWR